MLKIGIFCSNFSSLSTSMSQSSKVIKLRFAMLFPEFRIFGIYRTLEESIESVRARRHYYSYKSNTCRNLRTSFKLRFDKKKLLVWGCRSEWTL